MLSLPLLLGAWRFLAPRFAAGAGRDDIEEHTRIGRSEVRRALKSLETDRFITRQTFGRYVVCEPALPIAKAEIDATRKAFGMK